MASVAEIDGLKGPLAPVPPPLDQYTTAAAAYSVRLLRTAYTGSCMRVREDGGNTETDIGFDGSGNLDTAAIASHCGSNNGFIRYWYDQSGNANDAGQATEASQPQIYNGTSVITDNGKPAIEFDGALNGPHLSISTSLGITGTTSRSVFCVLNPDTVGNNRTYFGVGDGTTASNSDKWNLEAEWGVRVYGGNELYSTAVANNQYLSTNIFAGTNVTDNTFYLDGSAVTATSSVSTTISTSTTVQYIGAEGGNFTYRYDGTIQELLIWASDQESASNRTGIETNINGYFSIF